MKIQFLTSYYPPFLADFYKSHTDFASLAFSEMLELLLNQYFADTGAAHFHMMKHGCESFIIIANCEPLQKKWAQENNVGYSDSNWQKEIALAQIKAYKPDVFYLESIFEYFGDFVAQARSHCKFVVSWISTPFSANLPLNGIDLFLSSTPDFVDSFRKKGFEAEYMLPSFDSRVLGVIENSTKKNIPFSFVGGWSEIHINRKSALKELVEKTPIQLWGYGYKRSYSRRKWAYYKNLLFPENKEILARYNGEVWGLSMYEVLQQSFVTFNIHESLLKGNVGNMRMFEASGVGTLILNDEGHNLSSLFEVGKEIVSYSSIPDAVEKFNYYQNHPELAIEIGLNAQKKTLSAYNYDVYAESLKTYLTRYM